MKPTVYMEEMDAFTYREKLAKDAVVFIPVGALEQHGSHMAMCVDAALTKAMAGATAEALVADTDGAMEAVVAAPSSARAAASTSRAPRRCRERRSSRWRRTWCSASSCMVRARSC